MTDSKDVIKICEQEGIRFIKLQFTDILGAVKTVTIPVEQLPKGLEGNIAFDGSSIEGFVRIEESDMLLRPDPASFSIFPWHSDPGSKTARLMCDIAWPDGAPFDGCPRTILQRVVQDAQDLGLVPHAGPEPEFFLFLRNDDGSPSLKSHDHAGYFDQPPLDKGEEAREHMVRTLLDMGFEIEASHHEVAPAQHEIDFKYEEALTTADQIATFRFVVRTVALQHNLHATFMPKPKHGIPGSGMHVHLSLFRGDTNIFYDPSDEDGLSRECRHFIAGLMHHARSLTAITNPLVNSYKRLVPGYEAPSYIAWSLGNRSPLIRVPARRGTGTRVEMRNPDPSCNPYLALAVLFAAGLDGMKNEMELGESVNDNIYIMGEQQLHDRHIESLPRSLDEALDELEKSELIRRTLTPHLLERFIEAKRIEWDEYRTQIHEWEIKRYLGAY